MIDRKSPLLDGTFGKVLSELEEKLREAEEKAKYWQDKYDRAIHEQIKLERELERLTHKAAETERRLEEELHRNIMPCGLRRMSDREVTLAILKERKTAKEQRR